MGKAGVRGAETGHGIAVTGDNDRQRPGFLPVDFAESRHGSAPVTGNRPFFRRSPFIFHINADNPDDLRHLRRQPGIRLGGFRDRVKERHKAQSDGAG